MPSPTQISGSTISEVDEVLHLTQILSVGIWECVQLVLRMYA